MTGTGFFGKKWHLMIPYEGGYCSFSFIPATPLSLPQSLEGIFELTHVAAPIKGFQPHEVQDF